MNVFSETNYKAIIKGLVKTLSENRPALTLKFLSDKLPVQYTYLSKCLNDDSSSHLSEDHVYKICRILDLDARQSDYVMLLRTQATSSCTERLADIDDRLKRIRIENYMLSNPIRGSDIEMPAELQYLLDPMTTLIHIALDIESVAQNPSTLISLIGVGQQRLDGILTMLERLKFIELSKDRKSVQKVHRNHFHISSEHPLSAVNQRLLQIQSLAQLEKINKNDKDCMTFTFSSDPKIVEQVRQEFREFIRKIEGLATQTKPKSLFQLNFELVKWF